VANFAALKPRQPIRRRGIVANARAGLVLGVESIPDSLASGVLAGVSPVAGLYGGMFGMLGGVLFTGTGLLAVQSTGAMAILVADVDLEALGDPQAVLCTLTLLTGLTMVLAGILRADRLLRFVSHSVMTGFVSAVGVSIVLGQLDNATGYTSEGANRILRAFDLLVHPGSVHLPTLAVAALTAGLIVLLRRTRLGALGIVVAVAAGSLAAAGLDALGHPVALVSQIADVPASLPAPVLPSLGAVPDLLLPAASLAFVGLIQGAGISASLPADGRAPGRLSRDFVGQGAGNLLAGLFRGMPVGGSMSASSLAVSGGAANRTALVLAAITMALLVLFAAPMIGLVAMPALAALLIVIGFGAVNVRKIRSVAGAGQLPATVMAVTFLLTLLLPLQFAVLVGVGISAVVFVAQQAGGLRLRRIQLERGRAVETSPPATLPAGEVVILQPYGAIFYATAATLREVLPQPDAGTRDAVVILRLRGAEKAGATLLRELGDYAGALRDAGSKLVVVTDNTHLLDQLGGIDSIGEENLYHSTRTIGEALRHAAADAHDWIGGRTAAR
jgi:SulP family sulfate permease